MKISFRYFDGLFGAVLVGFVCVCLRLFFLIHLPNEEVSGNDQMQRLEQAIYWYHHPHSIPGSMVWLPLHHILLSSTFPFFNDKVLGARLITCLLGIASCFLVYRTARILFSRNTALFAFFLAAITPMHIIFSVRTMAEVPFIFFLMLAVYAFIKYEHKKFFRYALLYALAVVCFCGIRYEGWIWAMLFSVVILVRRHRNVLGVLSLAAPLLVVGLYVFYSLKGFGVPFYGLEDNKLCTENFYKQNSIHHALQSVVSNNELLPWTAFAVFSFFIIRGIGSNITKLLFATIVIITCFQLYQIAKGDALPHWRFFLPAFMLLIPFAANGMVGLADNRIKYVAVFFLTVAFGYSIASTYRIALKESVFPVGYLQSAEWINKNRQSFEKVVVESGNLDVATWTVYAGVRGGEAFTVLRPAKIQESIHFREITTPQVYTRMIRSNLYKYWLVPQNGWLEKLMMEDTLQYLLTTNKAKFESCFSEHTYSVYRLIYEDTSDNQILLKYESIFNYMPQNKEEAFRKFGDPDGLKGNKWMCFFALVCIEADNRLEDLNETQQQKLIEYITHNFPAFPIQNPDLLISSDAFVVTLRDWAAADIAEAEKAWILYAQKYRERKSS